MRKVKQGYKPERGYVVEMFILQSGTSPYVGMLLLWYCDGSTDAMAYSCPLCDGVFPPDYQESCKLGTGLASIDGLPIWKCPSCEKPVNDGDLRTSISFRLTPQNLAVTLAYWFEKCDRDATLRIRRFKSDSTFRSALQDVGTTRYKDKLQHARSQKAQEWVVYPLSRITKDLSAGADLVHTIEGFVKA